MAHYGRLRDYRFKDDVDDIRGASLYGVEDEKLGKIDDVIFDHSTGTIRYAIVDSGGWLSSKKFLVAADRIRPDAEHEDDFYADMTREQIEALPRYDEDKFGKTGKEGDRDWSDYDDQYRKSLETTGGVMHREMSTHTITPEPTELPATGEPLPDEDSLQPERIAGVFTDPTPDPSKVRLRTSGIAARAEDSAVVGQSVPAEIPTRLEEEALDRQTPSRTGRKQVSTTHDDATGQNAGDPERTYATYRHGRLAAFEDHLRRNRVDITAGCRSCGVKEDKVA